MAFNPAHVVQDSADHARWLHELRSVVNTASVATAIGRGLARTDFDTVAELLAETERALLLCRELLASAGEHVREDDPMPVVPAAVTTPRPTRRTVGEELDRNRERRGAYPAAVLAAGDRRPTETQRAPPSVARLRSGTQR